MNKRSQIVSIYLILALVLLVACAPQAAPTPTPAPQASTPAMAAPAPVSVVPAPPVKPAWQVKWEEVVQRAKNEGRVVLYTTMGGAERGMILPAFEREYGVRLEWITGRSSEVGTKLGAERRAGLYQADIWLHGTGGFPFVKPYADPLEPAFILPELTEPELVKKTWYFGELSWVDKERKHQVSLIDLKEPLAINTNLVKPGEITAYSDLLNPKWKAKISLNDPTVSGLGQLWISATLETGSVDVNYMRELAKQQGLFITRDQRLQVEWLAHGKHAIAIAPGTAVMNEVERAGAPVQRFRLGVPFVSGGASGLSLFNRAPHPSAARLFINWLLSKEGQTAFSKAYGVPSQRLDVPTGHLDPSKVVAPELKVFVTWTEEFVDKMVDFYMNKLAKEIFGPYMAK